MTSMIESPRTATNRQARSEDDRQRASQPYTPRFDLWEGDEHYMLFGDLPGVSAEGLEIDFEDLQLTIRGSVPDRGSGRQFLHSEYGIGDFHRVFTLSETIDPDRISAEIRDGVVKITLPKVEQAKPRRIEVKSS